ncbi:uncharacterized protein N7482_009870 [Penicillium canariense]|uniref:Archaemetzincin-2 n=1 Tax=Penicillium canariense TaxID=189055 RepID=A0A9W9HQB9_9EURO|nr:uncharacterized protein N7482_009870 [Penicillium canariense]KAJ5153392.1 hypothetical protein N7482_009870 [Penicillium canariense]
MSSTSTPRCAHQSASVLCSRYAAAQAGFIRPDKEQRLAATRPEKLPSMKKAELFAAEDAWAFPAPLLLPGDDLAQDPEYPPQSFQDWLDEEDRNPVTTKRKTIYVVTTPEIDEQVQFMQTWEKRQDEPQQTIPPSSKAVVDYLGAFYHGLRVKALPGSAPTFTSWDEKPKGARKSRQPNFIGLKFSNQCVRIRIRITPDRVYGGQLNLDDLLDAAIAMLPRDAYAVLLLVNQDLYEDEDDEFVCGRAYGGSRVAVVSTARYQPELDKLQSVERLHAWPASHCEEYMSECSATSQQSAKRQKKSKSANLKETKDSVFGSPSPLVAAISVYRGLEITNLSQSALSTLWLGRVCRTAAHELGHCFGIDHCVYYACAMQGTASIAEDARQPPYLCPVDLAKLTHATGTTVVQCYKALLAFCERPEYKQTLFFSPFAEWIQRQLDRIDLQKQCC